jgi:hypothetical protein
LRRGAVRLEAGAWQRDGASGTNGAATAGAASGACGAAAWGVAVAWAAALARSSAARTSRQDFRFMASPTSEKLMRSLVRPRLPARRTVRQRGKAAFLVISSCSTQALSKT